MSVYNSLSSTSYIVSLCVFFLYLFFHGLFFFNMDVGSFLRKLFGEPVRGANIFLFGPNKLHTTRGGAVNNDDEHEGRKEG